jgi:hypothetical protein
MSTIVDIPTAEVLPDRGAVLRSQGIPSEESAPERLVELADLARAMVRDQAGVRGIWQPVTREDFAEVYAGEGRNADPAPIADICARAEGLTLFAATLGDPVCATIRELFAAHDYALASLLDGAASETAERMATWMERHVAASPGMEHDPGHVMLAYSPGYCGWHLSAQARLFARLAPERIGIRLRESFLMDPLKSISGVLLDGPPAIHQVKPKYGFCRDCKSRSCVPRSRALRAAPDIEPGEERWTS